MFLSIQETSHKNIFIKIFWVPNCFLINLPNYIQRTHKKSFVNKIRFPFIQETSHKDILIYKTLAVRCIKSAVPPGLIVAVVQPFKNRSRFYKRTYLSRPSVFVILTIVLIILRHWYLYSCDANALNVFNFITYIYCKY